MTYTTVYGPASIYRCELFLDHVAEAELERYCVAPHPGGGFVVRCRIDDAQPPQRPAERPPTGVPKEAPNPPSSGGSVAL